MFSKTALALICLLIGVGSVAVPGQAFAAKIDMAQRIGKAGLKSHCDAAGGKYGEGGGLHYCVGPGGDVSCSNKTNKCTGYTDLVVQPDAAGVTTIPCDPFLCKIFCGGKPYCTFGTTTFAAPSVVAVRPKLQDVSPPSSLVTSVPGGGSGTPVPPHGAPSP